MDMTDSYSGLPDPERDAAFYRDIPTKRFVAWIVDVILIALMTVVLVPFTLFTALFYLPLLYMTVGFIYRASTLARGSATFGMRLTGAEFRDRKGNRLDAGTAFFHTLGYTVAMSTMVLQLISIGLMLTQPRKQGLVDLVLGTAAINRAVPPGSP